MRSVYLILFFWLVVSFSRQTELSAQSLSERIKRIENGLQPNLQIQGEKIPRFQIEDRMKELGIPGVSLAILVNGKIEWAKAYGWADVSEERKASTETYFLAGSISKPVAAIRAHQLAEQGKINLDTNVNSYLTSWKVPENEFTQKEKVTTRRILNHTAGLTVWGFPGYDKGDTILSVTEVLDGKGNTDSVRVYKEPGESWMYSGGGYTVMQLMITDLEKKTFPEIMKSHVLNPLGMKISTFENPLPEKYQSMAATGYRMDGSEVEGKWPIYPEMAAAGLWTTPSELILWAKEIQEIYQKQKDGILKKETVNAMLTPGENNHGLGPVINEFSFGHGGADEGFRAQLTAWKDVPVAVVIMVNSDNGSIMKEIMLSIASEYGLKGVNPSVRTMMELAPEKLESFVGKYEIPNLGKAEIITKDKGLEISAEFLDEPIYIVPESEDTFFEKSNGDYFRFSIEAGLVKGFKVQNFEATKLD